MHLIAPTAQDRKRYRRELTAMAARLANEVAALTIEGTQPTEPAAMRVDAVSQQVEWPAREAEEETAREILLSEEQILAEARDALARLDAGTFGECERCGGPIAKSRLEAIPYARHCITCAATPSAHAKTGA
jgi:RNA polymerase-binding transcription factor DksA